MFPCQQYILGKVKPPRLASRREAFARLLPLVMLLVWMGRGFPSALAATPTPSPSPAPAGRGAWVVTAEVVRWVPYATMPSQALTAAHIATTPNDLILVNGRPWKRYKPFPPADTPPVVQVLSAANAQATIDGASRTLTTTAPTWGEALAEMGVTLHAGDRIQPHPLTSPQQAPQAEVQRAAPLIAHLGEHTFHLYTAALTVGQALAAANLAPQGLETTSPPDETSLPLQERPEVTLHQVWERLVLRQLPVAFETKSQPLPDEPLDTIKVVQEGTYGLQMQRVRVRYEDGVETLRLVEDAWLASPPKPRIVGYGTKIVLQTLQTPDGPVTCWRIVRVYATSYSPCRLGTDYCSYKTYSGRPLRKGVVAVLRSWYGYMAGQKVYIPGYGFGVIGDIGGGIPGRHWIDLGYEDDDYQSWHQWTTLCFVAPPPPPEQIPWILP